ncbi:MAG: peptide deformylase [Bacteroidota bacterium]
MRSLLLVLPLLLLACSGGQKLAKNTQTKGTAFTEEQKNRILEADTSQPMRLFLITNPSDSLLLRTRSRDVVANPKDPLLQHFLQRLQRTVKTSLGVGIAAPQVGILKNIIWVQRFDKPNFPFEAYLNPRIKQYSKKKQPCREGCLSIPARSDTTQTRAYAILLEYDRPDGQHEIEMVEDFTAVIFQHEIDHLNGILYIDHLEEEMEDAKQSE